MNREHKELKRISTAFLPLLSRLPEDLVDLGHGDESAAEAGPDPLGQYMQQIKGESGSPCPLAQAQGQGGAPVWREGPGFWRSARVGGQQGGSMRPCGGRGPDVPPLPSPHHERSCPL